MMQTGTHGRTDEQTCVCPFPSCSIVRYAPQRRDVRTGIWDGEVFFSLLLFLPHLLLRLPLFLCLSVLQRGAFHSSHPSLSFLTLSSLSLSLSRPNCACIHRIKFLNRRYSPSSPSSPPISFPLYPAPPSTQMKERESDLENGNSDELYMELSQTLGVILPEQPHQPADQQQHFHRPTGGLSIVTQSPNPSGGSGVGRGGAAGYGQSYHNDQGHARQISGNSGYHPPGQPVYGQVNETQSTSFNPSQYAGSSTSHSTYRGQEGHGVGAGFYDEKHYPYHNDDTHSMRSRRPDQLQQRDLDKAKAERMEKRSKKSKRLPKDDDDKNSKCPTCWVAFSRMVTCCFPGPLLTLMGKHVRLHSNRTRGIGTNFQCFFINMRPVLYFSSLFRETY